MIEPRNLFSFFAVLCLITIFFGRRDRKEAQSVLSSIIANRSCAVNRTYKSATQRMLTSDPIARYIKKELTNIAAYADFGFLLDHRFAYCLLPIASCLAHTSLQANRQQLLRFDGKLHRQLVHDFLCKSVYDQRDGCFSVHTSLIAIEDLVLTDF